MANPPPTAQRSLFRPRNLILAAIYIAVALALVWMITRPSPDQTTSASAGEQLGEHPTSADTAATPARGQSGTAASQPAAGRRPDSTSQPSR
jgi:hypothetical protein